MEISVTQIVYQRVRKPIVASPGWEWAWAECWVHEGRIIFIKYFN